ncbi:unnamed protein product, partial [Phaeothamnion confervicola]
GKRRRPTPTIELKATEIATEMAAGSASPQPPAAEPPAEPPFQSAPSPPPPPPEEPPPFESPPPQRPAIAWLPPDFPWPMVGAGIAGGAGALLGFLLIWLMIPASDPSRILAPRLTSIESQLRELNARPVPPSADPKAVDDLSARLARLETAAAAPRPPATDPALANRLAALESTAAARLAALENTVKPLSDNLAALARRTDDTAATARESAAAARDARSRADASATTLGELQNAARTSTADHSQIETLANRIAVLEGADRAVAAELAKRATDATNDRTVRLAVAAGAMRAAVERGDPFTAELTIVKPLAGGDPALPVLEPFAASGVPGAAALGRELGGLVPSMLQAAGTPAREGGIMDRLQANAQKLVRIRPIDEAPGDDPGPVLARLEAKAAHADIPGALAELAKLPPQVRAPAQGWIAKAEARGRALEASRRLASDAVAALKTTP